MRSNILEKIFTDNIVISFLKKSAAFARCGYPRVRQASVDVAEPMRQRLKDGV
jgi:hypothetical protein